MRAVDTTGVVPLQAIRDETAEGEAEAEVSLDDVEGVLGREEQVGAFGRKRRRRGVATEGKMGEGEWDPLSLAERKVGRYFVVESGHGGTS
ncbi:MAG: hypothetical protein M1832_001662 [Thelocarpon impressellum]|nr:MAG: hypothetical protein M1832_001662 [Thelocarpon impressellum]